MALAPGTRLGPFEVSAKLGEGGMGEVYRATDTRLRREVAVKVLSTAFTADPERLARFEREAQLLAQMQHPNIAAIYGLEEQEGVRALVMELVEGADLSARIARGPLPLDEALAIARQIAEALEAAHEQGIVHRDLKPANVKLRADGMVKVLDFGLAKAMDTGNASLAGGAAPLTSPTLMNSPTLTGAPATQLGMILGTAAYMAPEQARGKGVDKRADVWAFGVVLFEMLTGSRLFAGEETSDVLAAVLRQEVGLEDLPTGTPPRIRRLLARCLERDPKRRLRDIGEARIALEPGGEPEPATAVAMALTRRRRWPLVAAIALATGLAAAAAWRSTTTSPPSPTLRLSIALPTGERVTTAPAISPNGATIAYVAGRSAASARLYLRDLNDYVSRPVDSGAGATWPFFSPDGRSVAFFAAGKLWRAPVTGGPSIAVATASRAFGGSWGTDGRIVFTPNLNAGLWRVPAVGGDAEQLTRPDGAGKGYAHVFPQVLPNGEVLFTFWGNSFFSALLSPSTGSWRAVTIPGPPVSPCLYVDKGFLLRGDSTADLLAARWTPEEKRPTEIEAPVLDSVYWLPGPDRTWFAVSHSGTAVYVAGDPSRRHLVWVDRSGGVTEIPGEPDQINAASLSWAGDRIAHNGRGALWVRDVVSGTRVRLLSDITWVYPGGWLPGDQQVVYSSNMGGDWDLYAQRASGGDPRPLLRRPSTQHPMAVAPDGSVVFTDYGATTGIDLWVLPPGGKPRPLVVTPFNETSASVSSDGRYVAYVSDAAGRNDVYAIPFAGGEPVVVSADGGTGPVWSRDGRELFYRSGDDMIGVAVKSTSPLVLGEHRKLLDLSAFEPQYFHDFEVAADGQRFLFIRAEPESRPTHLNVILNWLPEMAGKVAAR